MKKVAIYARVSTDKQTVDNQLIELRNLCECEWRRIGYQCGGLKGSQSIA